MIENTFEKRKHVLHYDTKNIPTKEQITDILSKGIPLTTSKQKSFAFKAFVLGPNSVRSNKLLYLCEKNKIKKDHQGFKALPSHNPNSGLFHVGSAPWTLIWTPRVSSPNPHYKKTFDETKSHWQMDEAFYVDNENRMQVSIEAAMMAKIIEGLCLDSGWDSSFCLCYTAHIPTWKSIVPDIEFSPIVIQTIGIAKEYYWKTLTPEQSINNTNPTIEDLFKFV
jgi:hypothetical protein|tara:strand:+ start:106 stop:774 length:669 start_codon:yes stop_codon:yes gene_type:complete